MSKLLTTREAAELLRMSEDNLRDLVAEGVIPAVRARPGGRLLFDPDQLRAALRPAGAMLTASAAAATAC